MCLFCGGKAVVDVQQGNSGEHLEMVLTCLSGNLTENGQQNEGAVTHSHYTLLRLLPTWLHTLKSVAKMT